MLRILIKKYYIWCELEIGLKVFWKAFAVPILKLLTETFDQFLKSRVCTENFKHCFFYKLPTDFNVFQCNTNKGINVFVFELYMLFFKVE